MNDIGQQYVEYPSRKKSFGLLVSALVFVLLGILLTAVGLGEEESAAIAGIGIICTLFFGFCLAYLLLRFIRRTPSLVVDDEGIVDQSSAIGGGRIRWDEMEDLKLYVFMNQAFIGIRLHDPESFLDRQGTWKRLLMKANRRMVDAPVNIAQTAVALPLDELYELLVGRWAAANGYELEEAGLAEEESAAAAPGD
ncbi:hypothetical protein J31TS4_44850 [Paenibacillus sp. J31TS4]|uniref:STM3941 family protein n=1 Tax=Paenibacillus sp. J31TS4 TaxID=2807195 RepID=UPI001B0665D1|nr:STM3941 family protein [Paenibacillus sp. J31TS4]GIP41205.1 hypothetical protein J31TS4_44850 [Paenibacillus sp. J31TS4]